MSKKNRISKLRTPLEELPRAKVTETLLERGLIDPNITTVNAKDIVQNHNQIYHIKSASFARDVVAFVTPWNKDGYRIAKRFRHKFSMIVPCWYNYTFHTSGLSLRTEGIDKKWLTAWRKPDKLKVARLHPKIVPRFYLRNWSLQDFESFLGDDRMIATFASKMKRECDEYGYDGVLLDFGPVAYEALGATPESKSDLRKLQRKTTMVANRTSVLLQTVSEVLAKSNLTLHITVAPPTHFYNTFPIIHPIIVQRALAANWVKDIIVMTYDQGGRKSGSAIAPLSWAIGCCKYFTQPSDESPAEYGIKQIAAQRIRMTLNFFGTNNADIEYEGELTGADYIKILKEYKTTFKWDDKAMEHKMEYFDEKEEEHHNVYYPTLLSLYYRLEAAHKEGYGFAIWELGQGLEYFMDLL